MVNKYSAFVVKIFEVDDEIFVTGRFIERLRTSVIQSFPCFGHARPPAVPMICA